MQKKDFEKQVQEKMEELSFVPSPPVWQKVEEQIRKKDRRRLIFWIIPLCLLLAGGGIWFLQIGKKGYKDASSIVATKQKQHLSIQQSHITNNATSDSSNNKKVRNTNTPNNKVKPPLL